MKYEARFGVLLIITMFLVTVATVFLLVGLMMYAPLLFLVSLLTSYEMGRLNAKLSNTSENIKTSGLVNFSHQLYRQTTGESYETTK